MLSSSARNKASSFNAEQSYDYLGPLPRRPEVTEALAETALRSSITIKEDDMPEQYSAYPESFKPLIEDAKAEEAQQAPADYTFAPLPPELVERPEE